MYSNFSTLRAFSGALVSSYPRDTPQTNISFSLKLRWSAIKVWNFVNATWPHECKPSPIAPTNIL